MRTLWLTNDLPPRPGGIEQFIRHLVRRTDPGEALVLGPDAEGAEDHDRSEPYVVRRLPWRSVLPTPTVLEATRRAATTHRADVIVLGSAWPLGELAGSLRRDTGLPVIGLTHGLEAGLASVGLGWLVRRATRDLAAVTTISAFTGERLRPHLPAGRVARLPPGVDVAVFRPDNDGSALRRAWGVPPDATLVGCVSRLVKRKGQDVLLDAWPSVRSAAPGAWLVLVGDGPRAQHLRRRAADLGPASGVVLAGTVPWRALPAAFAALDVFAMPCRTRLLGVDVEGLGIVYLEAQATGVPVVAGRSGGAPETVIDGGSGLVVDGADEDEVAGAVAALVADPERRRRMGESGRRWVERHWSWEVVAGRFRAVLEGVLGRGR